MPLVIHDISVSGCKIESEAVIELHEKVRITIDTESLTDQPANCRWTSKTCGRTMVGLKFVQPDIKQIEEREGVVS
ncbi:PilZ domain-containing protein [Bacillus sp. SL00103]